MSQLTLFTDNQLQEYFERQLAFHYGSVEKLKEALAGSIEKYKAAPPTKKILDRIVLMSDARSLCN